MPFCCCQLRWAWLCAGQHGPAGVQRSAQHCRWMVTSPLSPQSIHAAITPASTWVCVCASAWKATSVTAHGRGTLGPTAPRVSPRHCSGWALSCHYLVPSAVLRLCPTAELWTRLRDLLKPSPAFYHFVLTHFRWLWDIINSTFIRDTLMRLVLTGMRGGTRTLGISVGMGGTRLGHFALCHLHAGDVSSGKHPAHKLSTKQWLLSARHVPPIKGSGAAARGAAGGNMELALVTHVLAFITLHKYLGSSSWSHRDVFTRLRLLISAFMHVCRLIHHPGIH